ncbi:EAL domain-containing protein [Legionella sp. 29fVS95]|uniref:EAL domain-containing protein n=1 Tax=Legionella sp. 29fVS95 TaxID=3402813 RepID=UPI003AF4C671
MNAKHYANYINAQRLLNFAWVFLAILLIIVSIYYQRQQYHLQKQQQLQLIANEVALRFDNFLDKALDSAYTLPFGHPFENCEQDILPVLRNIIFNNPAISGAVISDQENKIICSTLEDNYLLPAPSSQNPAIFGPIPLGLGQQPAFLVQQRMGKYYFGIYIIKNVIEDLLRSVFPQIGYIGLYNEREKKIVFHIGNDTSTNPRHNFAKTPLQDLDNYSIIITVNQLQFNKDFFLHQSVLGVILLLVLILLYLKFRMLLSKRFSLNYALSNAIKHKHFNPVYQPIMDNANNRFCGAEVLLRWHTNTSEILPDVFIEEAEKSGLIVPITLQLIEKSFQQCHQFLKTHSYFHLAFNLSASHFQKEEFFTQFYHLSDKYQIPAQQILIELTERELLDQNDSRLVTRMNELRARGHSLAIDDFGTGHASIKYLQHFPFNYLKIDKLFVHSIGTGAVTETLSQAIIQMANVLKLTIIAEGVETIEQFNFLRHYQINLMQGWYFAKAMPHEQLFQLIEEGAIA